ncbi:hypothetical protein ACNKHS_00275 [Shigella flexneri]
MGINGLDADFLRALKRKGFADARLAKLAGVREAEDCKLREPYDLHPVYKRVEPLRPSLSPIPRTCTPPIKTSAKRTRLLTRQDYGAGGGQTVFGQAIQFDYCCVHASPALREDGY